MFRRIFAAALGAGIGVGVLIAALQQVALVPMILEAEKYEKGTVAPHHEHGAISTQSGMAVASLLVTEAKAHDHEADAPMVAEELAVASRLYLDGNDAHLGRIRAAAGRGLCGQRPRGRRT